MLKENEVSKVLEDHERRIASLEGKSIRGKNGTKSWYKPGSTIEKIISLINDNFFNEPRSIKEIVSEFKTKDYHLSASDLTLPLRKIVRKGLLRKTDKKADGSLSKIWLYVKV